MTIGLVPSTMTAATDACHDDDAAVATVLRLHPGFAPHSIGYNAETGLSVVLL